MIYLFEEALLFLCSYDDTCYNDSQSTRDLNQWNDEYNFPYPIVRLQMSVNVI